MSFQIGSKMDTLAPFILFIKDIINGRTYIASITRYGKSWTCRKIIEEVFGHCGIIIIDPEGEYSSLREKYPFLIIGIDVPIQIETAEFMAEQILKNDLSVILDTSKERDDKEYVRRFLEQFFYLETTARRPYLLVVEEAEDYGPEKGAPGSAECLPALIAFAKKGGKRGIGCIFVGHRPAWISKGILSQCSNKALGKIESTDFKALEEYARVSKFIIEKLPDLKSGEFCFTGDWVKEIGQIPFVKVGSVKTTHLGMTPEIIPPSPKALESVIGNLQRSLIQVIESVKPKVTSVSETEARLKKKFEEDVTAIRKTADEKAERKYRVEIDGLKDKLGDISRSAALQTQAPITDVLEHPIVKARMAQMDQRSQDLLIKIEHEPGLTREILAAFLSASTNTVAGIISQINRVFKADVIVDDGGRPIKYRSMLKRLYLTDVARREIDELNRLQQAVKVKDDALEDYKSRLTTAQSTAENLRSTSQTQKTSLNELSKKLEVSETVAKDLGAKLNVSNQETERLEGEVKRLRQLSKIGEAVAEVIAEVVHAEVVQAVKVEPVKLPSLNQEEVGKIRTDVENLKTKVEELGKQPAPVVSPIPMVTEDIGVQNVKTIIPVADEERMVPIEKTDTLRGKILKMALDGYFAAWRSAGDTYTFLIDNALIPESKSGGDEVTQVLNQLTKEGNFGMKHTDRNRYRLAPNVTVKKA